MKSKVSEKDLETPHLVEWAISNESDNWDSEKFATRQEAIDFSEGKNQKRYAVWLGEVGDYETDHGSMIRDFMLYWWTEKGEAGDWPRPEGRGHGVPWNAQKNAWIRPYLPFDKTGWKG